MANSTIRRSLFLLLACSNISTMLAAVYQPPGPLPFYTFTAANESWFEYPETAGTGNYTIPSLLTKPQIGIAISGGGFRAATLGLGYLRALHMLNITTSARYLTSNSGGSWLNAAFSFQDQVPLSTFFGPYIPPEQLQLQQLKQANLSQGSFANVIANAGILIPGIEGAITDAFKSLKPGQQQTGVGAWSTAVGQAFLEPYGLNSDASTFTAAGTAGPVHQAVKGLPAEVQVYTYRPEGNTTAPEARPFPIMMGSILLQNTSLGFYGFEFTPLYVGSPPYFNDTSPPIGGGFVDPVGFNTPPPNPKPTIPGPILRAFAETAANVTGFDNGTLVTNESAPGANASRLLFVPVNTTRASTNGDQLMRLQPLPVTAKPKYLVPLKVVMGISSSFITNNFRPQGEISRELTGTEELSYWNQIDFTGKEVPFADGGSADNLAITPLLRRRVPKIILCVAASQNISSTNSHDWASYQWDIAALFGACPPAGPGYDKKNNGTIVGIPVDLFNKKLQVFPTEGYNQLYDALKKSTAAGGPTYHLATYNVLTNPFQAIFGGWKVEVLWVVSQQQTKWEQALPQEVQAALAQSRGGQQQGNILQRFASDVQNVLSQVGVTDGSIGLDGYPFTDTGKANYSPGLTVLLSQQSTWQMLQLQQQLKQLLAGTNATMTPVPNTAQKSAAASTQPASGPASGAGGVGPTGNSQQSRVSGRFVAKLTVILCWASTIAFLI